MAKAPDRSKAAGKARAARRALRATGQARRGVAYVPQFDGGGGSEPPDRLTVRRVEGGGLEAAWTISPSTRERARRILGEEWPERRLILTIPGGGRGGPDPRQVIEEAGPSSVSLDLVGSDPGGGSPSSASVPILMGYATDGGLFFPVARTSAPAGPSDPRV